MTQDRFDRWLRRPGRIVLVAVAAVIGLAACGERTVEAAKQTGPASPEQELAARLQAEAARGDAAAQVNLGVMHVRGEGVPRNIAKAVDLFRRAAAQGNAAAQVNLGLMYANGEGVPRNINRAQELLQQAAAQGNADAEVNLGLMHVRGELGPKDLTKAHDLFHRAAVQGQPLAQNNLGLMYHLGDDVTKDQVMAHVWTSLAAQQGVEQALKNRELLASQLSPAELAEAVRIASRWKRNQIPVREPRPGVGGSPEQEPGDRFLAERASVSAVSSTVSRHINGG